MEGITDLENILRDLFLDIQRAKNFVDDGKEVLCSNKLQGALVKCANILNGVQSGVVAKQNSEEQTRTE